MKCECKGRFDWASSGIRTDRCAEGFNSKNCVIIGVQTNGTGNRVWNCSSSTNRRCSLEQGHTSVSMVHCGIERNKADHTRMIVLVLLASSRFEMELENEF